MNYKTLPKREESIAEKMIRVIRVICEICGLNEIYCNLSVFVYPVTPEDGTGVTLWLNYYLMFYTNLKMVFKNET